MFKIFAVQSQDLAKEYCLACGTEYRDGYFLYAMCDCESGRLMGIAQFEICGDYGYILDLKEAGGEDDFEAMFILGRSTMNFIDLCGSHKARAALNCADERLIKAIGFRLDNDEYFCDMSGMFSGHCDGKPAI